ncbi:MAG: hypothetical protein QOF37_2663, partial [Thermoleophilaceae bacterium]|nr:hypothetical protein [Thermoleophilaceae bacterium]
MGIISGIFKRSASEGPPGPMVSVTSFVCIHEDPQFCVVRVTASEAGALDDELLELHVVAGRRTHRFLPTERRSFDQAPQDGRTAEFVLPVSVLGSDNFTLHLSSVEVRLGRPPRADDGGLPASSGTIADAFLSQQNRLAFQVRKLAELRSELRGERDTASHAEEELEEARERFNKSLLGQREENHALVERAEKAEAAAERDRAEREKIEAERQEWLTPVKQELQSSRAHAADLQKEMQALATGLQEERAAREA